MSEPVTVEWDGKDLARIQMATIALPRTHGEPFATVEQGAPEFRLRLGGVPVPVGSVITIRPDIAAVIAAPGGQVILVAPDGSTPWEPPDGR